MNLISNRVSMSTTKPLQADNLFVANEVVQLQSLTGMPARRGYDRAIVSGGKIVNIVSSSYGHLPNEVFFKEAEQKLIDAGLQFDVRSINRDDRAFACDFILNDPSVTIELKTGTKGTPDTIKPMLRFVNSYDGSIKTSGSFGFFRQVCSNGLHVAESKIGFNIKHSRGVQELVLPSIGDLVKKFIDNEYYTLRRRFEVMYDCVVDNPLEFTKAICKTTGIFKFEASDKNPNPSANARLVLEIADREAKDLGVSMNSWIMYNAFNNVLHNKLQKSFKLQHQIDHDLFEVMSRESIARHESIAIN